MYGYAVYILVPMDVHFLGEKTYEKRRWQEIQKKYERESRQALKTSKKTNRLSLNIKKKDQSMPIDFRELIFNTQF